MSHWEHLIENKEDIFGFIQVDIAGHSEWKGADIHKKQTKENLHRYLKSFAESNLDIRELKWEGDGGSYYIPMLDQEKDYNSLVYCAIHFLYSLEHFNRLPNFNRLGFPIAIRISCHEGRIHYSSDSGNLHGEALNYFLKYEREIGSENTVTITEEIYQRLTDNYLRNQFNEIESHEYKVGGHSYSKQLYRTYTREPSQVQVFGTYKVHGKKPDKTPYAGLLQIKKDGELFEATWIIGDKGTGASMPTEEGTGLRVGDALAFSYKHLDPNDPYTGIALYLIMSDVLMSGPWTKDKESKLGFEKCEKKKPDE